MVVKTGVIGVGSMGKNHVRVYSEISDLVGISDLNEDLGREIAANYKIKYFKNYEDLLKEVEAVSIVVPTVNHLRVAKKVISSNTNLLIEKPFAMNHIECKEIIDFANESNVTLAIGHIERHNPVITDIKRRIEKKQLGDIITLSSKRLSSFPGRIVDVGVIFDLAIHDIDIMCYLAQSSVKSVYCTGGQYKHKNCEDYVMIFIEFDSGLNALCEANWLTPTKVRQLNITTDKLHIVADYMNQTVEISEAILLDNKTFNDFQPNIEFNSELVTLQKEEPLKNEILDFLLSIEKGKLPLVSGIEGARAVEVAEAAQNSLQTGNIITNFKI